MFPISDQRSEPNHTPLPPWTPQPQDRLWRPLKLWKTTKRVFHEFQQSSIALTTNSSASPRTQNPESKPRQNQPQQWGDTRACEDTSRTHHPALVRVRLENWRAPPCFPMCLPFRWSYHVVLLMPSASQGAASSILPLRRTLPDRLPLAAWMKLKFCCV